jgi:hypothetical protein
MDQLGTKKGPSSSQSELGPRLGEREVGGGKDARWYEELHGRAWRVLSQIKATPSRFYLRGPFSRSACNGP